MLIHRALPISHPASQPFRPVSAALRASSVRAAPACPQRRLIRRKARPPRPGGVSGLSEVYCRLHLPVQPINQQGGLVRMRQISPPAPGVDRRFAATASAVQYPSFVRAEFGIPATALGGFGRRACRPRNTAAPLLRNDLAPERFNLGGGGSPARTRASAQCSKSRPVVNSCGSFVRRDRALSPRAAHQPHKSSFGQCRQGGDYACVSRA